MPRSPTSIARLRPTFARINTAALLDNLAALKEVSAGERTQVLAIVKADAYGHGAAICAPALAEAGVAFFGVALLEEALALRALGITQRILVMSHIAPGGESLFLSEQLTPLVGTFEQLEAFEGIARAHGVELSIHLELDTGMNRQGFNPAEWPALFEAVSRLRHLRIEGVSSHFANADVLAHAANPRQRAAFAEALAALGARGVEPAYVHLANSAGYLGQPASRFNLVRLGLALYGYSPFTTAGSGQNPTPMSALAPVLSWHTQIVALHDLGPGESVSYGGTFTTARKSRIATLCVGYADGYARALSNRAHVLVRGQRAPIVGRVCMDLCMCDVTDIADARLGDEVLLIGAASEIISGERVSAEELAGLTGTITYEVLTAISARVPREATSAPEAVAERRAENHNA